MYLEKPSGQTMYPGMIQWWPIHDITRVTMRKVKGRDVAHGCDDDVGGMFVDVKG